MSIREIEWTPPIFGWQYRLYWAHDGNTITASSWNWKDWPATRKYHIHIDGSAYGTNRMHWTVYFIVNHNSIGVRFVDQDYSLTTAIRAVERQVKALEAAVLELRRHSKGT